MNKKSILVLTLLSTLFILLSGELFYLNIFYTMNNNEKKKKRAFVKLSTLPDLAIATDNYAIRHRTLNTIFAIYPDDGTLREYSKLSYIISH